MWLVTPSLIAPAQLHAQQSSDPLGDYLKKHGLNDLLIVHYQKLLEKESSAGKQKTIAGKLVNQYLAQLSESDTDNATTLDQLKKLTGQFPSLATFDVQLALNRYKFISIQRELAELRLSGKAELNEQQIKSQLDQLRSFYQTSSQQLSKEIKLLTDLDIELTSRDRSGLIRLETQQAEVIFYWAWSEYYRGVISGTRANAVGYIQKSNQLFRDVLGISHDANLAELDRDWLDLESGVVCRAIAGLAMVQTYRGDSRQRDACFDWLSSPRVPPKLSALRNVWQLQAAIFAGNYQWAIELVNSYTSTIDVTEQSIEYWILVAQTATTIPKVETEISDKLMQQAIAGSLRLGQFTAIEDLLDFEKTSLDSYGAYGRWAQADMRFREIESGKSKADGYITVVRLSEDAAKTLAENKAPSIDRGRCLALAAWSYYRARQWQSAAELFSTVYDLVKTIDSAFAADSLWMRIESLKNIKNLGERNASQWLAALDEYQRVFPHTDRAASARFELTRARTTNMSESEIINQLKKTPKNDPNYAASQLEIARLYYRIWQEASDETAQQDALDDLESFVNESINTSSLPTEVKLKASFLLNDCYLRSNNHDQTKQLLSNAKPLIETLEKNSSIRVEYLYQQMQLARQTGDLSTATSYARDMIAVDDQSAFAKSALTFLANQSDQGLSRATDATRPQLRKEAIDVYSRLSKLFGQNEQAIAKNRNARIVFSKLASLKREDGQTEQAAEMYQTLLAAFPKSRTYLTEMALIHMEQKQLDKALVIWNRLVAGIEEGTEPWYQAKYNQMLCLETTNLETAKKIFAQFQRLHPNPPEKWANEINQLGQRLELK